MTVLGIVFAAVVAVALVARRSWLPVLIGIGGGLPATASVVVAGNGIPMFSIAAVAAGATLLRTRPLHTAHWSANALAVFLAWATVVTGAAPWLFAGARVLVPRDGIDDQLLDPGTLAHSVSNVAQLSYLLLAACVLLFLVRTGGTATALRTALLVGTVLTAVRGVLVQAGIDFFGPLTDTMPIQYSLAVPGERLRGVFSEPSELAAFALPAAAYFVITALRSPSRARSLWWVAAVLSCANLLQAASGTAVVASAAVIALAAVVLAVRWVVRGGVGTVWMVLGGLVLAIVALTIGDQLAAPVQELVEDKVGSQSYDARTGADVFSWGVVRDTLGLGAGLGANRPSSFGMTLLSCVGVPGALAFAVFVVGVLVRGFRAPQAAAAAAGLTALLAAKLVGTPDLSTPVLWLFLAACAASAWPSSAPDATTSIPNRTRTPTPTPTPTGAPA